MSERDIIATIHHLGAVLDKQHRAEFTAVGREHVIQALCALLDIAAVEEKYLEMIDLEAIRRGYMPDGDSLVSATGQECWLDAWRHDPTLTPEEQVDEEIAAAAMFEGQTDAP